MDHKTQTLEWETVLTTFFLLPSPSAAFPLLLWPLIPLASGRAAHPYLRVREIMAGMIRSLRVTHPPPLSTFSFSFVLSWSEPAEPPPPPFWFCFLSFSSVPILFRWASLEPRGGSWLRQCTSFLTTRLSLTVGVISSGRGCSEDNWFGVIFHIELLSSTLIWG